ncbi:MAG: TauD/TfdA family dioxygenase [Proteobacteria bacterium]|nr:TauD/TfdA family dioxygenase [Pseudomonadota bacterium]
MNMQFGFPSVFVPPIADDFPLKPVHGPQAWYGPELARTPEEWTYTLSETQISDLHDAIQRVEAAGIDVVDIRAEDFALPSWRSLLQVTREAMFDGRGFAVLRGFPVAELSPLQRALGYFGVGSHFGVAISQNAKGHAVGHVCDLNVDYGSTTGRGYQTNARLPYHSDSSDLVGLLCVNKSKTGGLSSLASSVTLYNEMLKQRPDLVRHLMGPVYRDRREEIPEGQGPWYVIPAFNPYQGRVFTTYVRSTVRKAQRFADVPRISPLLEEAMDLLDAMADDPAYHLDMNFEPGDIQFVCNHFILHSRTTFEDHGDRATRRHLLRLQLACADGPALPPVYENLRGYNEMGRPAGMHLADVPLNAPLEPIDGGPGASSQRLRAPQDTSRRA